VSYEFYKAYLTTATSPAQQYADDLQAMVDDQMDNASSYYTIQEEVTFGTISWQNVSVRIEHIVYSDSGEKLGDDYKSIIFQDFTHARGMGYRYYFDNNVWVTVNTDQKKYVTASAVLRRCDNIMQKLDVNGNLIQEPCFFGYNYANDSFNINKETVLADGEIQISAQNNANTKLFQINDRVLFGGQAYKIESMINFKNTQTYVNDTNPLIVWKACWVEPSAYDDVVNNIPNNTENVYIIDIAQSSFNNVVGFTSTLSATVKLNGEVVSKGVTWSSSDATKVSVNASTGVVSCVALGSAVITAKMTDNILITDTITITVVASITPVTQIRILPNVTEILETDTQTYTVYKYINDAQQADTFTITTGGVAAAKYDCTVISGNSFSITNNEKDDDNALVVTCTDDVDATYAEISIELGGIW
jgi:uncharacterized protein YjdB